MRVVEEELFSTVFVCAARVEDGFSCLVEVEVAGCLSAVPVVVLVFADVLVFEGSL